MEQKLLKLKSRVDNLRNLKSQAEGSLKSASKRVQDEGFKTINELVADNEKNVRRKEKLQNILEAKIEELDEILKEIEEGLK